MAEKPTPPNFQPFEVISLLDGDKIVKVKTYRHPDGSLEQWKGDKRTYGPAAPEK